MLVGIYLCASARVGIGMSRHSNANGAVILMYAALFGLCSNACKVPGHTPAHIFLSRTFTLWPTLSTDSSSSGPIPRTHMRHDGALYDSYASYKKHTRRFLPICSFIMSDYIVLWAGFASLWIYSIQRNFGATRKRWHAASWALSSKKSCDQRLQAYTFQQPDTLRSSSVCSLLQRMHVVRKLIGLLGSYCFIRIFLWLSVKKLCGPGEQCRWKIGRYDCTNSLGGVTHQEKKKPEALKEDGARLGLIQTYFGDICTPAFLFCGTKATVKGVTVEMLREAGTQIILANTYHLLTYPGPDVIESLGRLQHFTNWHGPMFTDSGGFQMFSLQFGSVANEIKRRALGPPRGPQLKRNIKGYTITTKRITHRRKVDDGEDVQMGATREFLNKTTVHDGSTPDKHRPSNIQQSLRVNENGVVFRNYRTGDITELTPEKAIEAQCQLGADLIVVLDECTSYDVGKEYTAEAMHRSHRWALRCLRTFKQIHQAFSGNSDDTPFPQFLTESKNRESLPRNERLFSSRPQEVGKAACFTCLIERHRTSQNMLLQRRHTALSSHYGARKCNELNSNDRFLKIPIHPQGLYGVVHGGVHSDLRRESAAFVNEHDFFGAAIGGSLGASQQQMRAVVEETAQLLRRDRPIHLLGVGGMRDIFHGVRQGIDTFDCVQPTRAGRHGSALVPRAFWEDDAAAGLPPGVANCEANRQDILQQEQLPRESTSNLLQMGGRYQDTSIVGCKYKRKRNVAFPYVAQRVKEYVDLGNAAFKLDDRPILPGCVCFACTNHSRGYIHYLLKAGESLGGILVTIHNVFTMNKLLSDIRHAIRECRLDAEEQRWIHPSLLDDYA